MAPPPKSTKKEKTATVPADEEPKPDTTKSPKPINEIDEIFQATKSKKRKEKPSQETEQKESEKKAKRDGESKKGKKKGKKSGSGRVLDEGSEAKANRRRTNDGLAIYSAEELGFGNPDAGGTALCPFDCDCCF
ncbi:hypothetical protein LUZ61_001465 [Rhynchospora tenuis]|uniref:DUF1764-domain-containing protein n=1 Tax=Rhynchospora tenuis TaxID=198213 RepID=A0AAD5ZH23_9POAL|nr:hypothetical protein LUZ61_001465 [Rhynchospora tenuis]